MNNYSFDLGVFVIEEILIWRYESAIEYCGTKMTLSGPPCLLASNYNNSM